MTRKISRGDDDVSVVLQILNETCSQVIQEAGEIAGPVGPIALGCAYIRYGVELELQTAGLAPATLAGYLRQLANAVEAYEPFPAMTEKPPPDTEFTRVRRS